MDSPENEALENRLFQVRFSGGGTLYVKTPGEWYIHGKSEVPPEVAHLLCVVEIVVWCARQAVEVAYPPETTVVLLSVLRVNKDAFF